MTTPPAAHRPRVAVAFHSGYGHTAVLADAVRRGAEKAGADVSFIPAGERPPQQDQYLMPTCSRGAPAPRPHPPSAEVRTPTMGSTPSTPMYIVCFVTVVYRLGELP